MDSILKVEQFLQKHLILKLNHLAVTGLQILQNPGGKIQIFLNEIQKFNFFFTWNRQVLHSISLK